MLCGIRESADNNPVRYLLVPCSFVIYFDVFSILWKVISRSERLKIKPAHVIMVLMT